MQSHKTAAKDSDTIVISSLPEASPTPASKPKSCKQPLSVDKETNVQLLHDDDSEKKGEEVNIFQREAWHFVMGGEQPSPVQWGQ